MLLSLQRRQHHDYRGDGKRIVVITTPTGECAICTDRSPPRNSRFPSNASPLSLLRPGLGCEVWRRARRFVCPLIASLTDITSKLHEIFCRLRVNYGRGSDDSAICYVLPVLWKTSYLSIMGYMTRCQSAYDPTDLPGGMWPKCVV